MASRMLTYEEKGVDDSLKGLSSELRRLVDQIPDSYCPHRTSLYKKIRILAAAMEVIASGC